MPATEEDRDEEATTLQRPHALVAGGGGGGEMELPACMLSRNAQHLGVLPLRARFYRRCVGTPAARRPCLLGYGLAVRRGRWVRLHATHASCIPLALLEALLALRHELLSLHRRQVRCGDGGAQVFHAARGSPPAQAHADRSPLALRLSHLLRRCERRRQVGGLCGGQRLGLSGDVERRLLGRGERAQVDILASAPAPCLERPSLALGMHGYVAVAAPARGAAGQRQTLRFRPRERLFRGHWRRQYRSRPLLSLCG
mmetsp:Transcript_153/g.389  ORF Transcript_153/g.389 Transcript_153/m.389 type:complete len:256 (+) Transcript_153:136-903(+)